ncbi:Intracellular growth attenuator protein igaA [Xenorhabdus mauleonii]|uniref:intracellular growth attenuator protein IgaA n=1 Tax=Xenorhabdus mauleonii TaxID=351675 RepID=A0A1I3PQC4_9GAMM|nr:IgaA/UmoB family intracellular growth attenuator [Xenorhabdus mauleonii]PHM44729.1 Intracellular growth attenuator protein igaA [Xenorhabdus mauleonii]SFJ23471.1 Intracellular growth attenuator protein IgaA [Xenorhabdus mauleonii]
MSSLVIILAIFIISLIIMASFLIFRWRRLDNARYLSSIAKTSRRKLNTDELQSIEHYLRNVTQLVKLDNRPLSGYPVLPIKNDNVYTINHAITRFSAVKEELHHWRYYIDDTEIHFPVWLEPFIKQKNTIEIIQTTPMPMVIAVNGHFLKDYQQNLFAARVTTKTEHASIQKNGNSSAKLLHVRKETPEEYRLRYATGGKEGVLMGIGLLVWFVALFLPIQMLPWLMLVSFLFMLAGFWSHFRFPSSRKLLNINCFNGIPKRWGVFSEFAPEKRKNISLGGIDLVYPTHWESYISYDLDQNTDIDMYANNNVTRQGRYLSLHEEEKHYPYQRYRKNLVLVIFSVIIMLLLYSYQPASLSMRLSLAWLYGSNTKVINSVAELQSVNLKEGDVLKVKGVGMCYEPPNFLAEYKVTLFAPFDCIGIYWNKETPLPMLESDIVENASALLTTVYEQLHSSRRKGRSSPSLNQAIAKSGLVPVDNYAKIVLKAHKLCPKETDCLRLKNALVNLGSATSWGQLLADSKARVTQGYKVLMRAGSADALEKLVDATTEEFIYGEINKFASAMNSPLPGGVLLRSDESRPLLEYPMRINNMFENTPMDRWLELQHISELLMRTPFETGGIVTELFEDPNGTLNIMLHREPDTTTLIRYLGSCLLMAMLLVVFTINAMLIVMKRYKNKRRLEYITLYYDNCFASFSTTPMD